MYVVFGLLSLSVWLVNPTNVHRNAFTLPKIGYRLNGKELKIKHNMKTTFLCASDCIRLQECSAYNYLETNESCQLIATANLSDSEPDPNSKVVLKKLTCNINPCLQGGTCHEVPTSVYDVRGYKCSCPCGRCGHNCNRLHFGQVEDACIYLFNAGYKKVESQEECMSFCWDTQGCRSADYISSEGACWLNSVTGDEEPLTMDCDKWYPGVAYLFFNCTCDPSD